MSFRFSLAPLLRLRQSVERQCALVLREVSGRVARMQATIAELERFLAACEASDEVNLRAGRKAAELQFAVLSRDNLLQLRSELQAELNRLELARQQAASDYQQAYREREVLETLRRRQRRQYQQEQIRRQQRELDAAHLLQRWRNPLG